MRAWALLFSLCLGQNSSSHAEISTWEEKNPAWEEKKSTTHVGFFAWEEEFGEVRIEKKREGKRAGGKLWGE